jgi:hypothetical protein
MTPDWLLVETLGTEPVVVAHGNHTLNLVPVNAFLRRDPNSMTIQTAIAETVRAGQGLSSITPKNDRVVRTEVVQMTDGTIHGVHLWVGPPNVDPPARPLPGPLKWDLTDGVATDTTESLANSGRDPSVETTHGRAFAEDLPTRDFNEREAHVLSAAIEPEPGKVYCSSWDLTDHAGNPIVVGFVARIMAESDGGPDRLICRAMNWRSVRDESTKSPAEVGRSVIDDEPPPGVHRALVDLKSWTLLKWLDEPCPYYDWRHRDDGEPMVHPDDADDVAAMTADFESRDFGSQSASRVLRLHGNDGGWTPIHVTVNRVELGDGVYAGMLSLREPTEAERAAYEGRPSRLRLLRNRIART